MALGKVKSHGGDAGVKMVECAPLFGRFIRKDDKKIKNKESEEGGILVKKWWRKRKDRLKNEGI